jgi:ferredoxin, 2Fe-2S
MPKVTYIEADGTEHCVDAPEGISAMEAALTNDVPGIDGDCGGQAACATCHVFVDPDWIERTGHADPEIELPMIELSEGVQDNSRLACQIKLTAALDGLILRMPEAQF